MLTVAKVTQGSAAGYADYVEGKAQAAELGDYYLKDGERVEAPGRWAAGTAAVGARPELPVTGEQLRSLMAVQRPETGVALRRWMRLLSPEVSQRDLGCRRSGAARGDRAGARAGDR
jgi:hypothetical protein